MTVPGCKNTICYAVLRFVASNTYEIISVQLYMYYFFQVLQTFKALHRTRMTVFKDDDRALTGR